jgi:hypothetical protein
MIRAGCVIGGQAMKALKPLTSTGFLAAIAGVLLPVPAAAEPTPIEVAANATWQHDAAKVRFPPAIDGFRRTSIIDYGDQRFDVSARYFEEASQTLATLYLFRAPLPDVPLWHDRALISIRPHEALGTPDHAAAVTTTFTPPGSDVASGLLTVMPLSGRSARSTALAVFRQGRWLIKVRMTSDELDTAQLKARLETLLAALPIEPIGTAQAATAMADCTDSMRFKNASRADRPSSAVILSLAMAGDVGEALEQAGVSPDEEQALAPLCRDAASQPNYGIYRRVGVDDRYVVGFGDAGVSAAVGRDGIVQSLNDGSAKDFWVSFADPYKTSFYRGFKTLPTPAQAIAVIDGEEPLSSVERSADGNSNISIQMD